MTTIYQWGADTNWASGPRTGTAAKLAMVEAEIKQGLVGGLPVAADRLNWYLNAVVSELRDQTFGRGVDGAGVISGSTTLTRDMFYSSLDVQGAGTLTTGGFRVFVQGTLTISGVIRVLSATASGSLAGGQDAIAGVSSGTPGGAGVGTRALGGNGGAGGSGNGGANAGGSTSTAALPPLGRLAEVLLGAQPNAGALVGLRGGASGGSGGGGSAGTSGAGGKGGGIVLIAAENVVWNGGSIQATGGAGETAPGTNAGGGGGGGGGAVILIRGRTSGSTTYTLTGGVAGNGTGTGTGGTSGSVGVAYEISA